MCQASVSRHQDHTTNFSFALSLSYRRHYVYPSSIIRHKYLHVTMRGSRRRRMQRRHASTQSSSIKSTPSCRGGGGRGGPGSRELRSIFFAPLHEVFTHLPFLPLHRFCMYIYVFITIAAYEPYEPSYFSPHPMCVCCHMHCSRQQLLSRSLHFLVQVFHHRFHLLEFGSGFVELVIQR